MQLADDAQIEWVPWEECPKREQELQQQGRGRERWMADASGVVKEKEVPADTRADVSTALRLQWALKRRGLALDIAGILSYDVHDELVDKLIESISGDTFDPRYAPPSMAQARAADREIWKQMQRAMRGGFAPAPAGVPRPLDEAFRKAMTSAEFCFTLLPLPTATSTSKKDNASGASSSTEVANLRKEVAGLRLRLQTPPELGGKGKGKGEGKDKEKGRGNDKKGRGKGKGRLTVMPVGLKHCVAVDGSGARLCFNYNLGTCTSKGTECPRGRHACARPGCFGPHPEFECSQ